MAVLDITTLQEVIKEKFDTDYVHVRYSDNNRTELTFVEGTTDQKYLLIVYELCRVAMLYLVYEKQVFIPRSGDSKSGKVVQLDKIGENVNMFYVNDDCTFNRDKLYLITELDYGTKL